MKEEKKATRQSYGETLEKIGEKYKDIVVLDADLSSATKTINFAKKFSFMLICGMNLMIKCIKCLMSIIKRKRN